MGKASSTGINQQQNVAEGGIGVQVIGDSNRITIHAAKKNIPVPALLPYLHDRNPQIERLSEQGGKLAAHESIKFLVARGNLYDAPEQFGQRIRDQLLQTRFKISVQRTANAHFREASSKEDMVNLWAGNLRNSLCSAEHSVSDPMKYVPPILSGEQQWQQILESIDVNNDNYVFINTVVETSRCLGMPPHFWRHWLKEVNRQFEQLNQPGRIIIYISLSPPGRGWRSIWDNHRAKRIYRQLISRTDQRGLVALPPFGRVTRQDALSWNEEYFAPWFRETAAEALQKDPQEMLDSMRNEIRKIFGNSNNMHLADLGDRLTDILNRQVSSY